MLVIIEERNIYLQVFIKIRIDCLPIQKDTKQIKNTLGLLTSFNTGSS